MTQWKKKGCKKKNTPLLRNQIINFNWHENVVIKENIIENHIDGLVQDYSISTALLMHWRYHSLALTYQYKGYLKFITGIYLSIFFNTYHYLLPLVFMVVCCVWRLIV